MNSYIDLQYQAVTLQAIDKQRDIVLNWFYKANLVFVFLLSSTLAIWTSEEARLPIAGKSLVGILVFMFFMVALGAMLKFSLYGPFSWRLNELERMVQIHARIDGARNQKTDAVRKEIRQPFPILSFIREVRITDSEDVRQTVKVTFSVERNGALDECSVLLHAITLGNDGPPDTVRFSNAKVDGDVIDWGDPTVHSARLRALLESENN